MIGRAIIIVCRIKVFSNIALNNLIILLHSPDDADKEAEITRELRYYKANIIKKVIFISPPQKSFV